MKLSAEVSTALNEKKPLVALESALITHGLPYPTNLECAQRLEQAVREENAIPATIAVIEGEVHVGLSEEQLQRMARFERPEKISERSLGIAASQKLTGGTTVAATIWAAKQAGIPVMATGGIGGVHRNAPFDVSGDLPALARTSIVVVCAGAKAILDLPATREWLETHGVPLVGYQTDQMPAFYSRESNLRADFSADTPAQIASMFHAHRSLKLPGALLVGNPPPQDSALPLAEVEIAIAQALEAMSEQKVTGPQVTPFLLARMAELTKGESVQTNLALLANNARLGAQISRELARMS